MLTLVTGGSASGKSEYAESLVCASANTNRWYIATMQPFDAECEARIARHRAMRRTKGFQTMERYFDLSGIHVPKQSIILLECLSNLVANELFDPNGAGKNTEAVIFDGVRKLGQEAEQVIIVSNEVFSDGAVFDGEMTDYLRILGNLNRKIAAMADRVVELVVGISIRHK